MTSSFDGSFEETGHAYNLRIYNDASVSNFRERPYQHDSTASRLLSEVKHVRAQLVLRWGTTLESWVLFSFCPFFGLHQPTTNHDTCIFYIIVIRLYMFDQSIY